MNLSLRQRRGSALKPGLFGQRDCRTTLVAGASESLGSPTPGARMLTLD